jgi:transposase
MVALAGCTHVAMESTGVYWKPVYVVLEGGALEIVVANAQQVKKVPGRLGYTVTFEQKAAA